MLRFVLPICLLAFAAAAPLSALAQDEDGDGRQVRYKEKTEIDFEGVDVSGELVKPSGSLLVDRKKAQFNPMIRLRTDFKPEMRESINEVK